MHCCDYVQYVHNNNINIPNSRFWLYKMFVIDRAPGKIFVWIYTLFFSFQSKMALGCKPTDFLGLIKVNRGGKQGYVTAVLWTERKNKIIIRQM